MSTPADRIARLRKPVSRGYDPDYRGDVLALCDDYETLAAARKEDLQSHEDTANDLHAEAKAWEARCTLSDEEVEAARRFRNVDGEDDDYGPDDARVIAALLRRLLGGAS